MDSRLRRVTKLRLRSPDEALNRRGAILIEDAFRTATLPDADGSRLLVIRKLRLGRIRAGHSPSMVALRLEAVCREMANLAVSAASPDAAESPAVYFEDETEPYISLAVRIAAGEDTSAWFWPLVVREWNTGLSREVALRVIFAGALASDVGPMAALTLVRALLPRAALEPLLAGLSTSDGEKLLRAFGWTRSQAPLLIASIDSLRAADLPAPRLRTIAAPWFLSWGERDPRSLWLACALCAIERPTFMAQPSLVRKAAAWVAWACAAGDVAPAADNPPRVTSDSEQALDLPESTLPPRLEPNRADNLQFHAAPTEPPNARDAAASVTPQGTVPPLEAEPQAEALAPLGDTSYSIRAGLFFLVPVMDRLGMGLEMEQHPELAGWPLPLLVLRELASRVGTPVGDPVLAALGDLSDEVPGHVELAVRDWIRRIRQCTRRTARIGIYSLACRPGRVAATATHIDVVFRLDRQDIRVRRAGLDIDPGWTPWMARVIRFHYVGDDAYGA